jgi:hypothetical protein
VLALAGYDRSQAVPSDMLQPSQLQLCGLSVPGSQYRNFEPIEVFRDPTPVRAKEPDGEVWRVICEMGFSVIQCRAE